MAVWMIAPRVHMVACFLISYTSTSGCSISSTFFTSSMISRAWTTEEPTSKSLGSLSTRRPGMDTHTHGQQSMERGLMSNVKVKLQHMWLMVGWMCMLLT